MRQRVGTEIGGGGAGVGTVQAGRTAVVVLLLAVLALAADLEAQGDSLRLQRMSLQQGLSQSTVTCVLQDAAGFLWIGTQDGLNRYDGYGFEVFERDPTDAASLPADWIGALEEDASGRLWIGTDGGGLARWNGAGAFTRFQYDPEDPASLAGDRVRALHFDSEGDLWVGTYESGLDRWVRGAAERDGANPRFDHFRPDPADPASLSSEGVRVIHEDSRGNLWIGTRGGLDRFDRATRTFVHYRHDPSDEGSLSHDGVLSIAEDSAGSLWVGTENGLNRLDPGARSFVRFRHAAADPASLGHDWVRALLEDRAGRLWVGTDGGLSLFDRASSSFVTYSNDPLDSSSLSSDRLMAIFEDRGGLLWIGTQGGGINAWNPATWAFSHYASGTAGLSNNAVFAFSEDDSGRLWIATHGGINVLDRSSGRFTHYRHDPDDPGSLADDRIASLLHDRQGAVWVGTLADGLSRLDPETGRFRHFRHDPERPGSLAHDAITPLFEARSGEIWVGTFGGGLDRFDSETESFVHYRHDPTEPMSLSSDRVTSFVEDAGGFLWVGTYGGGLDRLHRDSEAFLRIQNDPENPSSLSSDTVFALHIDASGGLWAGTQFGLNRLERLDEASAQATFQHYYEHDGLPNDVVYGIQSDPRGSLWLSTNAGLSRFDPATGEFENFTRSHGLQSDEFNFNAHYRSASGELFFGGVGGFNAFHPDRIEANPHVPPVVLTSFTKLNRPLSFDRPLSEVEEIALDYRDYFFSFELASLDYAAPEKNRYRYKLEGFDSDWVDLGHRRRLTFTNLDAGRYTLRVQGSNNDGIWNEQGASVRIVVSPPPWKTWWAYALYVLCVVAVTGGFVVHQHRKVEREREIARRERAQSEERRRLLGERETLIEELEAKNSELERFNYTVSHDLKSPLVTIKGFLGLLQKDAASGDADRMQRDIRRISAAADRMGRLLEELLELSRLGRQVQPSQEMALSDLAREALEMIRGHAGERAVDVLIDPELPVVFGDRLRLLQLYQNLLGNALKYMGEQNVPLVEVGVMAGVETSHPEIAASDTVLFVRDNGIGIDERYHEKVFGLFERLDAATEGTGVGLALVKRIVEMHGGHIWVESEGRGCGSSFCFTLPECLIDEGGLIDEGDDMLREDSKIIEATGRFRKPSAE